MGGNECHGFGKSKNECSGFVKDSELNRRLSEDQTRRLPDPTRRFHQDLKKRRREAVIDFEDIFRKRDKERLARIIEAIKNETDPWKIVELAKVHKTTPSFRGCYDDIVVEGYEEKIAAMRNNNTPTLFILFLYHYPKEKKRTLRMDDLIGPRRDASAPYVNDAVRKAAEEALVIRGWTLSSWDRNNLSPEMVDWCDKTLRKDWDTFRLRNSLNDEPKTSEMALNLINFVNSEKR